MSAGAQRDQKRSPDPLELATGGCELPDRVLGTELGSFGRAASALTC